MAPGRRKMGMFDHAKYSQPVLRDLPESIQKAVERDIAALVNPVTAAKRAEKQQERPSLALPVSPVQKQRKRSRGEMEEDNGKRKPRTSQEPPIILASNYSQHYGNGSGSGYQDPALAAVRAVLLKSNAKPRDAKQNQPPKKSLLASILNPEPKASDWRAGPSQQALNKGVNFAAPTQPANPAQKLDYLATTPPRKDKAQDQRGIGAGEGKGAPAGTAQQFPEQCPLERIAANLMEFFPTITLRNNEPLTLTEASYQIAQRAVRTFTENQQNKGAASAEVTDDCPMRTLADQTMRFFPPPRSEQKAAVQNPYNNVTGQPSRTGQQEFMFDCSDDEEDDGFGGVRRREKCILMDESPTADLQESDFLRPLMSKSMPVDNFSAAGGPSFAAVGGASPLFPADDFSQMQFPPSAVSSRYSAIDMERHLTELADDRAHFSSVVGATSSGQNHHNLQSAMLSGIPSSSGQTFVRPLTESGLSQTDRSQQQQPKSGSDGLEQTEHFHFF